jgi:MinD-like ATPase involved in chromosome partitioning or flagellar assembly
VQLAKVAKRFLSRNPRLMGWIPESRTVRIAAREQRPFAISEPRSLSAQCIARLAARVAALIGSKCGRLSN